ncbi:MAG: hypothetical protein LBU58_08115, partial [Clostridiales bacterium]|nr:hypothetical protein [Clostridiales bacterium]
MLRIKNARVFRDDGTFAVGEIEAEGALFRRVSLDDRPRSNIRPVADGAADYADQEIDAEGCFAVPGLIDLHFHGCAGYDFS